MKLPDCKECRARATQNTYASLCPKHDRLMHEAAKLFGSIGGTASAASKTPEQRRDLALKAVQAREAKRNKV